MTRKRYELWGQLLNGSISKLIDMRHSKITAINRANEIACGYSELCVEEWDDGRNIFLQTILIIQHTDRLR